MSSSSRMVHGYYERRVAAAMQEREARLAAFKSRRDAVEYVERARDAVEKLFGSFPKRTPLKAVTHGAVECESFKIEKVVYESRLGFVVSGNLYMPQNPKGKLPCVLGLCGHDLAGKANASYQSFCQGLAIKGFAVLIIDPISQGERIQSAKIPGYPGLCQEHNILGGQLALQGDFLGKWMAWDAIRGLDYLLSRPEIDPRRVGVTGNSGGGTLASYVAALDSRVTMAAPSCCICSFQANMENEMPCDAEQNPPGMLAAGLDQIDLLLCHAPRPTLVLGQRYDFFDHRYALKRFEGMRKIYRLLGHERNAGMFIGPRDHGFHIENREAMYAWFLKHAGIDGSSEEQGVSPLKPEATYACKNGVAAGQTLFELNAKKAEALALKRKPLAVDALAKTARKLLAIPKAKATAPRFRPIIHELWSQRNSGSCPAGLDAALSIETEPDIAVRLNVFNSPESRGVELPKGKATLFAGNISSMDDILSGSDEARKMLSSGHALAVMDPRGLGTSTPGTCGGRPVLGDNYNADFLYASTGELLGEPYLGRRVYDALRTIDCLLANGATEVELAGCGLGSVAMTFAALLHKSKPRIAIYSYLPSYAMLLGEPRAKWPLSILLRGVLRHFDLPDVYAALGRRLEMHSPCNAEMKIAK